MLRWARARGRRRDCHVAWPRGHSRRMTTRVPTQSSRPTRGASFGRYTAAITPSIERRVSSPHAKRRIRLTARYALPHTGDGAPDSPDAASRARPRIRPRRVVARRHAVGCARRHGRTAAGSRRARRGRHPPCVPRSRPARGRAGERARGARDRARRRRRLPAPELVGDRRRSPGDRASRCGRGADSPDQPPARGRLHPATDASTRPPHPRPLSRLRSPRAGGDDTSGAARARRGDRGPRRRGAGHARAGDARDELGADTGAGRRAGRRGARHLHVGNHRGSEGRAALAPDAPGRSAQPRADPRSVGTRHRAHALAAHPHLRHRPRPPRAGGARLVRGPDAALGSRARRSV